MYTLITGASGGIGYELAKIFAKNGYNLILVARNIAKLEEIKEELNNVKVEIIGMDLSLPNSSDSLIAIIEERKLEVEYLINNAGIGVYGEFVNTSIEKEEKLINLNILTLTKLTKYFLKKMKERNNGGIINVASVASFQAGPLMAVYYASKAYVLSFTEAIKEEIRGSNISITALCPGATATNFEKSSDLADNSDLFKKSIVHTPEYVAQKGYEALMNNKTIEIVGIINKLMIISQRFVPRSIITKIVKKLQESK